MLTLEQATPARGRPWRPGTVVDVQVHLRLRVGEDDDLIAVFQQLPARQRATTLKRWLRSGSLDTPGSKLEAVVDENLDNLDDLVF